MDKIVIIIIIRERSFDLGFIDWVLFTYKKKIIIIIISVQVHVYNLLILFIFRRLS